MIDIISPETIIGGVLAALYGLGHLQERSRRKRGNKRPSLLRPVKRYKRKIRGWHLTPASVIKITQPDGSTLLIARDHKNWIRVFPNPGYRIRGKHWCRSTHRVPISWTEDGA